MCECYYNPPARGITLLQGYPSARVTLPPCNQALRLNSVFYPVNIYIVYKAIHWSLRVFVTRKFTSVKVQKPVIFFISSANSRQSKTSFLCSAMISLLHSPRTFARNNSKSLANSPLCPGVGWGGGPRGGSVKTVPSSNINSWNLFLAVHSRNLSIFHVNGLKQNKTTRHIYTSDNLSWETIAYQYDN